MKNNKSLKLTEKPIVPLMLEFWFSSLVPLVLYSLFTLTDALFVSHCAGPDAMGGISIVLPFTVIQGAISTALGGGASTAVAQYLGKGDKDSASRSALNAMVTFWVTALVITAIGLIFCDPILKILGATQEVYSYAKTYFLIIVAGNVFSTGFSSIIRAEGATVYGMLIWIIPIIINVIFDYLFVVLWGWGVAGSAVATAICQFTSFSMSILFFTRFSTLSFKGIKPNVKELVPIIKTGIPSLVLSCCSAASLTLINNGLALFGESGSVTIYAYINRIITFTIMPFTAFSYAVIPICGANHTAGKTQRVKDAIKASSVLAIGIGAVMFILLFVFGSQVTSIFTDDAEVISGAGDVLKIIAPSLIFMPISMIFGAYYQCTKRIPKAVFYYALNVIVLLIIVFPLSYFMNSTGTYIAVTASYIIACIITLITSKTKRSA